MREHALYLRIWIRDLQKRLPRSESVIAIDLETRIDDLILKMEATDSSSDLFDDKHRIARDLLRLERKIILSAPLKVVITDHILLQNEKPPYFQDDKLKDVWSKAHLKTFCAKVYESIQNILERKFEEQMKKM